MGKEIWGDLGTWKGELGKDTCARLHGRMGKGIWEHRQGHSGNCLWARAFGQWYMGKDIIWALVYGQRVMHKCMCTWVMVYLQGHMCNGS